MTLHLKRTKSTKSAVPSFTTRAVWIHMAGSDAVVLVRLVHFLEFTRLNFSVSRFHRDSNTFSQRFLTELEFCMNWVCSSPAGGRFSLVRPYKETFSLCALSCRYILWLHWLLPSTAVVTVTQGSWLLLLPPGLLMVLENTTWGHFILGSEETSTLEVSSVPTFDGNLIATCLLRWWWSSSVNSASAGEKFLLVLMELDLHIRMEAMHYHNV